MAHHNQAAAADRIAVAGHILAVVGHNLAVVGHNLAAADHNLAAVARNLVAADRIPGSGSGTRLLALLVAIALPVVALPGDILLLA